MSKVITLVFLLIILTFYSSTAQDFNWGRNINTMPYNWLSDEQGNIVWVGYYKFSIDVSSDTSNPVHLPYVNDYAGYVSKYDSIGKLIWHFTLNSSGDDGIYWVQADKSSNIIIGGTMNDTLDMDPGTSIYHLHPKNGKYFIAKYNTSGNLIWAFNSKARFVPEDIDRLGNIVFSGLVYGKTDINPGIDSFIVEPLVVGERVSFVAKFDSNGAYLWAIGLGQGPNPTVGLIKYDPKGNIYLAPGSFRDSLDFDPGPDTFNLYSPFPSATDARYLASYNQKGDFRFAKLFWTANGAMTMHFEHSRLYVSKHTSDTIDINLDNGVISRFPNSSSKMIIVIQYDSSASYLSDFQLNLPLVSATYVTVDKSGETIIGGQFAGNIDVDPSPALNVLNTFNTSAGYEDIFFAKYTKDFELKWGHQIGRGGSDLMLRKIINDSKNNLYLIGNSLSDLDWNVQGATDTVKTILPCRCAMVKYGKLQSLDTSISGLLCPGDSIMFGKLWIDTTGIYIDTLISDKGADSIVELHLNMDTIYSSIWYDTICENSFKWIFGQKYEDTGIYFHTLQSKRGCDSVIELHIARKSAPDIQLADSSFYCDGDSIHISVYDSSFSNYYWSNHSRKSEWNGQFNKGTSDSLLWVQVTGRNGCVSNDTMHLKHKGLSASGFFPVFLNNYNVEFTAIIHPSNNNWKWNFGDQTQHYGDTVVTHTYSTNGIYLVCLNFANECRTDSVCRYTRINVGFYEINECDDLIIYPNPGSDYVDISFPMQASGTIMLEILDNKGILVVRRKYQRSPIKSTINLQTNYLMAGFYSVIIKTQFATYSTKLVIVK